MKKIIALVLVLILSLSLAGCKEIKILGVADNSLYIKGMELVSMLDEMTKDEAYFSLYTSSGELLDIIAETGEGDRSEPKAVYEIIVPKETFSLMLGGEDIAGLSEPLKDYMISRLYGSLPTQINALNGANTLAAASVCAAGKTFVSKELEENTFYLYTFEDSAPVIVTFIRGEDNTVSATANFLFGELVDTDTKESVEQFFAEFSATVEVVEP